MRDGKVQITIIEDNKSLVDIITKFLELKNFIVNPVYYGRGALSAIMADRPDLIILDLILPDIDGSDLLAELKESEDTRNIPVIILTARDSDSYREYGMKLGADEYIAKPYSSGVLLEKINRVLDKKKNNK
ncbi:response regulator transcription factor [Candidatus Omnitrophota bacterium]